MISDGISFILSLVYLDFKQIVFSLIAVTISGKIISIIYNDEDQDEDSDKEDEQEETILV
ncbi:hypothetical protein ANS015_14190 [Paraclostridium bifermentans]|nr:hypothetical protein ANS015_14190 [Paraclostridium bifermentans]